MKFLHIAKDIKLFLFITLIILCFPVLADDIQKKVAIFPLAGAGLTQAEADSIADQAIDSICDELTKYGYTCVDRSQGMRSILKEKGFTASGIIEGNYKDIGKIVQAEFVMPMVISRFRDNSGYGIRCNVVNSIDGKIVPGMSVNGTYNALNQRELANQIKGLGSEIGSRFEQSKSYLLSGKVCRNITNLVFMEYSSGCVPSDPSNMRKFTNCYIKKVDSYCSENNVNNSQCASSCLNTATKLFETFLKDWDKQAVDCKRRGSKYTFDGECKFLPPSEHSGEASWLVPGLGLVLKNRPGWGIFFFGVTAAAIGNYSNKLHIYNDKKEEYRSFVPIPIPISLGYSGDYLYFDYRYKNFHTAARDVSYASYIALGAYFTQLIFSHTMNSQSGFFSSLEPETKKALSYQLNVKRDSSLGIQNSSGTLYTLTFTWGF